MFDLDLKPLLWFLVIIILFIAFGFAILFYNIGYIRGRNMGRDDILSGRIQIVEVQETKRVFKEINEQPK